MKYEFKAGDFVETINGDIGYISSICHCERCKERGFYESEVTYKDGTDYITNYEAENGFKGYKRIGTYDFTEQKHQKNIEKMDMKNLISYPSDTLTDVIIVKKLNEVIDRINEIGEKNNEQY